MMWFWIVALIVLGIGIGVMACMFYFVYQFKDFMG